MFWAGRIPPTNIFSSKSVESMGDLSRDGFDDRGNFSSLYGFSTGVSSQPMGTGFLMSGKNFGLSSKSK